MLIVKENEARSDIFNRNREDKYKKRFESFLIIKGIFGVKFILFYIPDNHQSFTKYPMDYSSRMETTFRMGFKGGTHLLFSNDNKIKIIKFYFDGHKLHRRNINLNRITKNSFREYVSFSNKLTIDDRQMIDRNDDTKILMSFVDNIIGAFSSNLNNFNDKYQVLYPIDDLVNRIKKNKIIKNINSKFHKSISISKLEIKNEKITFPNFFENSKQMRLFKENLK